MTQLTVSTTADATLAEGVASVLCDTCGSRPRKFERRVCARCLWLGQDREKARVRRREYKARLRRRRREYKARLMRRLERSVHFRSDKQDWATPPELFGQWHAEFGFTIDVCAHELNHKMPRWYGPGGESPDGLAVTWTGERCWMNPPYGRAIAQWTAKAAAEARRGAFVVGLVPARTDTRWWHSNVFGAGAEVRYRPGRIRFLEAKNNPETKKNAPFPSALVIWRPRMDAEVRS